RFPLLGHTLAVNTVDVDQSDLFYEQDAPLSPKLNLLAARLSRKSLSLRTLAVNTIGSVLTFMSRTLFFSEAEADSQHGFRKSLSLRH
ncbi:hypothetical protein TNCV_2720381, partial [Trichonephila clavipes]